MDRFGKYLNNYIMDVEQGDYESIPWIYSIFGERSEIRKKSAAKALSEIITKLSFQDIVRLDEIMRKSLSIEWLYDWDQLSLENFFTSTMNEEERRAVCIFSSFHSNGFIREQAVIEMIKYGGTLPYLILRQNDWVMEVRKAADKGFQKRMKKLEPEEFFSSLPYAAKIKESKYNNTIKKYFNELAGPEHGQDLLKGLESPQVKIRKVCIAALTEVSRPDKAQLLLHLNREKEPYLRKIIFEKLTCMKLDLYDTALLFLKDRYPPNRILALDYISQYKIGRIQKRKIVEEYMLDKNILVRAFARKINEQSRKKYNYASFYFKNLESHQTTAILGIGETSDKSYCVKIEKYLKDSSPAVISAAITALIKLDCEKYQKEAVELLASPVPMLVKTAFQSIKNYHINEEDRIEIIYNETPLEATRIKCAYLLFRGSKWKRIIFMLKALSAEEKKIRDIALQGIPKWVYHFNKSFVLPTTTQKEDIIELVKLQKDVLSDSIIKEIMFVLR